VLIVTKMDRLGRDAIDVSGTVAKLREMGVSFRALTPSSVVWPG
jgi:DNA invertase Pin-like site-specific DNA recombinase